MIKFYIKLVQCLAQRYIAKHQPIVVGVTGSAGKSTAVTAIGTVLRQLLPDQNVYFPSKQLNGELGLPLTIFQVEYFGPTLKYILTTTWSIIKKYISQTKPYDIIVLEYGVDHVGEMDVLLDIVTPDFAMITNIDTVHFGDPEITRQEKSKLIKNVKSSAYLGFDEMEKRFVILNEVKEPLGGLLGPSLHSGGPLRMTTFAIHNKQADINLVNHEFLLDNPAQAGTAGDVMIGDDLVEIVSNSIELYYLMYAAIGYDIALTLGAIPLKQLPIYFQLPAGRATLLSGIHYSIILDSSYNSSPVGTLHLLDILQEIRAQLPDYGVMCLMGEMRELYDLEELSHIQLADRLISLHIDYVGLVGESSKTYMLDPLVKAYGSDRVYYHPSSVHVGQRAAQTIASEDKKYIILVKGSQNTIFMEEAVKELLANSDDVNQLCRQSDRWMIKKNNRFHSL